MLRTAVLGLALVAAAAAGSDSYCPPHSHRVSSHGQSCSCDSGYAISYDGASCAPARPRRRAQYSSYHSSSYHSDYLFFKIFVWLPLCILIRCCCCDKKKPQVAVPASGATCVVNYRSKVRLGASINSQELGFVSEGEVVTLIETKITKNGSQRAQIRSQSLTGWINTVHKNSGQPTLNQAVVQAPNPTYNPAPMAAPMMAAPIVTTPAAAPTYNPAPMAPATMPAPAPLPAATAPQAASPASLHSFLAELGLGAYEPAMQAAGAVEAADLADLDEADMQEMGMKKLEVNNPVMLYRFICVLPFSLTTKA